MAARRLHVVRDPRAMCDVCRCDCAVEDAAGGVWRVGRKSGNGRLGGGGAFYSSVEETPRQYASVMFTPEIVDRGWPQAGLHFSIHEISQRAQDRLREVVRQVLLVTSEQVAIAEFASEEREINRALLKSELTYFMCAAMNASVRSAACLVAASSYSKWCPP